MIFKEEI